MNDALFREMVSNADVIRPDALAYVQRYPSLAQAESWRWTPLKALRSVERKIDLAFYQFDADEAVVVGEDAGADVLAQPDAPFAALNVALNQDTLSLTIPADTAVAEMLAVNIDALGKKWQFAQLNIVVEKGAKASLWLDMAVERSAAQLPLISLHVADNAEFDAVLWFSGRDASATAQLAYVSAVLGAECRCALNAVQSGGTALARLDVHAELRGEHSDFNFGGVQTLQGEQAADFHVNVRHLVENCTSHQAVRGVLNDTAQGIFDGMIYVAHGAQKTDAKQDSRYILLSKQAKSHSVPRLEIYADDVQCAHGSTVGFLDPDALFYLQSRGIDREAAQTMLITSFLHESVTVQGDIADALHTAITQSWTGQDE